MSYEIRYFRLGDEVEIIELLRSAFPRWAELDSALDLWKWKYLDNPLNSDIVVAEYDGHVVGVNHDARVYIKIGETSTLSHLDGNTVVDPAQRGKGLASKIAYFSRDLRRENNVNFTLWSSSNPIIIDFDRRLGLGVFPHLISCMVRIKDIHAHLRARKSKKPLAKKYGYQLLKNLMKIRNTFSPGELGKLGSIEIVDAPNFCPQIDTFWGKVRGHYNYALERNSLYLNWRYTDPRAGKFVIKQAVEGDQILGYVILESKKEGGYSEGYISDLLASPNRDDVADTLMAEACSYFDRLNINSINFWVAKNHPYLGIAERHGFLDSRYKIYIGCSRGADRAEFSRIESSPPSKVHFQFGDMDLF